MKRLMLTGLAVLAVAAPEFALAQAGRGSVDARREERADRREDRTDRREDRRDRREDRRDEREDVRDRREDVRDARYDGGARDRREDVRDRREDRRDHREDVRDRREDRWDRREDRRDWRDDERREWRYSRSDRHWWRGHPRFRDYRGARHGYWYAPGYGYIVYAPGHARKAWRRGEYLPRYYHRYRVYDPYMYGVRPAPRGYVWVHVDNDLVLISLATGLILDVLFDLY